MLLRSLHIEDLRAFPSASWTFDPGTTVFVGPNGAGKTTLLEGVSILASGRSLRTSRTEPLVRVGQPSARISGEIERGGQGQRLAVTIVPGTGTRSRACTVDGAPTPLLRFLGHLRIVTFTPDHLQLAGSESARKREFLDAMLARSSALLLGHILQYQRVLKQRNRVLTQIRSGAAGETHILPWDDALIGAARPIVEARRALVAELNAALPPLAATLSGAEATASIDYRPFVADDAEHAWRAALASARTRDIALGVTTVGPHRESIQLHLNGLDVAQFASRGEQRTVVLALKLAELAHERETDGEPPVLLLDDVLSELDPEHQRALLEAAGTTQTLITSAADIGELQELLPDASFVQVPEDVLDGENVS